MLRNTLFTSLPLLAVAAYLDPSLQQQKPLLDSKPASAREVPLTLDKTLHYTFAVSSNDFSRTPLEHLQTPTTTYDIEQVTHQAITINIPLNTSLPGTATFSTTHQSGTWSQPSNKFTWTRQQQQQQLHSQSILGAHIPLLDIGIRKGGMITMPAESATLDLTTPYIHIPKGIWDVLLLATSTEQQARDGQEMLYVDCGAMNVFPDLVFGFGRGGYGDEEEEVDDDEEYYGEDEEDADELVITPEQYVLQTTEGTCMLLAKNADSCHEQRGTVRLGWAAVRGREVLLDRSGGRVGFGKSV